MLRGVVAIFAAVLAIPATAFAAPWDDDAAAARRGLTQAVAAGRVAPESAARYDAIVTQTLTVIPQVPPARRAHLAGNLRDVARMAPQYTEPRALALFEMLETNATFLASNPLPRAGTDIEGDDGIVYRLFAGRGFQFHPLATFARLNAHAIRRRPDETGRLARALIARAVPVETGLVWEYYVPFGGGKAPWTSGMAQALAAQSFARSALVLADPTVNHIARQAYTAIIPRLVRPLSSGAWIRLYSFSELVVLNAQLQAILSLYDYAQLSGDAEAGALASSLEAAAELLLPRFDTAHWSRYALGGSEAPLKYHTYVVSLLRLLAARTREEHWRTTAERFDRYTREPPIVSVTRASAISRSRAVRVVVRLWVSKRSTVTVEVGGDRRVRVLGGGTHVISWTLARRRAPRYAFRVHAVDLAGNVTRADLPPIALRRR